MQFISLDIFSHIQGPLSSVSSPGTGTGFKSRNIEMDPRLRSGFPTFPTWQDSPAVKWFRDGNIFLKVQKQTLNLTMTWMGSFWKRRPSSWNLCLVLGCISRLQAKGSPSNQWWECPQCSYMGKRRQGEERCGDGEWEMKKLNEEEKGSTIWLEGMECPYFP